MGGKAAVFGRTSLKKFYGQCKPEGKKNRFLTRRGISKGAILGGVFQRDGKCSGKVGTVKWELWILTKNGRSREPYNVQSLCNPIESAKTKVWGGLYIAGVNYIRRSK